MFTIDKPLPGITEDGAPYWAACREGRLAAQRCTACGHLRFPPSVICPKCLAEAHEWTTLSGRGHIYSFIVVHRPQHPAFFADAPYNVAIVELDEGIRLHTNVVECANEDLHIGMPVEVVFERIDDEVTRPKFRPPPLSIDKCGARRSCLTGSVRDIVVAAVGRGLRIAQVAPLYERVPPERYGGTERVVSYLTEELVRLGHDVTLYASGDSITRATLAAVCPRALRLDPGCRDPLAPHVRMLGQVYRDAERFDVIHCHTDYLGLPLAGFVRTPTLVTLHGRLDISELPALYADHPDVPLVSISDAQRAPLGGGHWVATVPHGLPPALYRPSYDAGSYLAFVGRISPEKRPDAAIAIAERAGIPLKIAAKVDAVDRDYFDRVIRPLL